MCYNSYTQLPSDVILAMLTDNYHTLNVMCIPDLSFRAHKEFLYARLVGTYYGMARASVRLYVCLSVCLSVHKACKHHTD